MPSIRLSCALVVTIAIGWKTHNHCQGFCSFVFQAKKQSYSLMQMLEQQHESFSTTDDPTILDADMCSVDVRKVHLSSGICAQVMTSTPKQQSARKEHTDTIKPPLVFLHGSFHAAWCWTERYFPYFTNLGYPCLALSLRGTGGTPVDQKKVKIESHVQDLDAFLTLIISGNETNILGLDLGRVSPIVLAHSFGGLTVMKYLESTIKQSNVVQLHGVVMLCSVPPSGISKMILRGLLTRPFLENWRITVGMAAKKCCTDASNARALFFGGDPIVLRKGDRKRHSDSRATVHDKDDYEIPNDDLQRYLGYFKRDSKSLIDLRDLSRNLPSKMVGKDGRALFASRLPSTLVIGGVRDFIVDKKGVEETARYFGVDPIMIDSPHDVMLGKTWQVGADAILSWIQREVKT